MPYKWKNEDIIPLLKAYRYQPLLWNNVIPLQHVPKIQREEAYLNIINELGIPGLQVDDVKYKLGCMRQMYNMRRRKVLDSIPTGEGSDGKPTFVPDCHWYSYADEFLANIYDEKKSQKDANVNADKSLNDTIESKCSQKEEDKKEDVSPTVSIEKKSSQADLNEEKEESINSTIDDENYQKKTERATTTTQDSEASDVETFIISDEETTDYPVKEKVSSLKAKQRQRKCINKYEKFIKCVKERPKRNISILVQDKTYKRKLNVPENEIDTPNEFDLFCKSVAIQLKKMPLREALSLQEKIQSLVNQYRLAYEEKAIEIAVSQPSISSSSVAGEEDTGCNINKKRRSKQNIETEDIDESDIEEIPL